VGASRWKKNARSDPRDRETVGTRHSGGSHQRFEMDPSYDYQDRSATIAVAHWGKCPHGGPLAPQTAILLAREPQEDWAPPPPCGKNSSPRLTNCAGVSAASGIRSSVWMPSRGNWWGILRMQAPSGSARRNKNGIPEYARKLISSPGKRDALFWPGADMPPTPFAAGVERARSEG
jgi:Protein of unknown function (DUF2950)